jgi:hypothetical protein
VDEARRPTFAQTEMRPLRIAARRGNVIVFLDRNEVWACERGAAVQDAGRAAIVRQAQRVRPCTVLGGARRASWQE